MEVARPEWPEVERVLDSLLDRTPSHWPEALDDACHGDPVLYHTVESLLRRHDRIGRFMERPLVTDLPRLLELMRADGGSLAGRRVGPYRLVREIGRGGMGWVWLAERTGGGREERVAVKLLHSSLAGGEVERRFALERRVLGSLEHPNIARLVDSGVTDDGRVCLIMEYVDGIPIDVFSTDRALGVRDRVALVLVVVRALHHTHRHYIVHRDLKPSNILVTETGEVKLVDFGIAKLLAGSADVVGPHTPIGHPRWLTPSHAAPEQLRGLVVTPRTDIYQVGIVLHELLATATWETAARQRIDDLDAIVHKMLRPDPNDRYATAGALADDLQRWLDGRRVAARGGWLPSRRG
jgi:serine/threonine-protein kinase